MYHITMHDGRALCLYAIYVLNFSKNGFVFDLNLDLSFYDQRISPLPLLLSCIIPILSKYAYYITFKYDHLRQKYFMYLKIFSCLSFFTTVTTITLNKDLISRIIYFYGLKSKIELYKVKVFIEHVL